MRLGTGAAMEGRSGGLISFTVPVVPVVAVPSPKPKDKAPTMLTSLRTAMASMLLPAPLVLLPTVKEINPPRPSVAAPVPSRRCCRSTRCPTRTPTHYGRRGSHHRRTTANYDPEAAGRPFIIIRHIRHEHSEHRALLWLPLKRRWSETVSDWRRGAVKTTA